VHSHIVRLVLAAQPRRLTGSASRRGVAVNEAGDLSPARRRGPLLVALRRLPGELGESGLVQPKG
jgi:hypothetical protein